MKGRDDTQLIRDSLKGDRQSFEEIVERYYKKIYNVASRIVNNSEDAADITQTVFIKVYENLGNYNERYKFFSWIYRIAVNESLNVVKQKNLFVNPEKEIESLDKIPEEIYNDLEMSEKIENALGRIEFNYRIPIILFYFLDLSYDEMSYVTNISTKTVKSRLFTARRMLREILVKEGH